MKISEWYIINNLYKCLPILYYNWWPINHGFKPSRASLC